MRDVTDESAPDVRCWDNWGDTDARCTCRGRLRDHARIVERRRTTGPALGPGRHRGAKIGSAGAPRGRQRPLLGPKHKDALEKYQAAVAAWDHPAIRFNIVRCLILIDRPVEASENLALALKYGAEPLEDQVYREALSYQKLLANQIADVEIVCTEPGAKVSLDGVPLMNCPGKEKRRVAPGQHGVVAVKDGYLTKQMEIVVVGGKVEAVDIAMVPLASAAKLVHRWPGWIPWLVFGGGLAVAGVGGLIEWDASQAMSDYDKRVANSCAIVGCTAEMLEAEGLTDLKHSAEMRDKIGISVAAIGAASAVAGVVMLVMNRGQTVYDNSVERRGPGGTLVDVSPRHGGGMVTLSGRF